MSDTALNEGSVKDVLERVGDDVEKATAALALEAKADKPRVSLTKALNDMVEAAKPSDPTSDATDGDPRDTTADASSASPTTDADASSGPDGDGSVEVVSYEPAEDWMADAYPDGWTPAYEGEEPPRQSNNMLAEPDAVVGTDPVGSSFVGFGSSAVSRVDPETGERVDLAVDPDTGCVVGPIEPVEPAEG